MQGAHVLTSPLLQIANQEGIGSEINIAGG